jgi:hypothetical protein
MRFTAVCLLAIIGLVASTSITSASLSINGVDWARGVPYGGASSQITVYVKNNDNYASASGTATLQLSVPGWYTRTFQTFYNVPAGKKSYAITIPFRTESNWPKGNYNACVYIEGNPKCSPKGVVVGY